MRSAAAFSGRDGTAGGAALRAPGRPARQLCRGGRPVAFTTASAPGMTRHGRLLPLRASTRVQRRLLNDSVVVVGGGHLFFRS